MEHMWRSGDNFTKAVLFFHYVGPRWQSQVSGLMVDTFIHRAFVLYLETLNISDVLSWKAIEWKIHNYVQFSIAFH